MRILIATIAVAATIPGQGMWGPTGAAMAGWATYDACAADLGTGPCIYVAGNFAQLGGTAASGIARWDGVQWASLGAGFPSADVRALNSYDDGAGRRLYCGGSFTTSSGAPGDGVVAWDGAQWSAVGGFSGLVYDLEVFDDGAGPQLIAAGRALASHGAPLGNVARWDGSQWTNVGGSLTHSVALTSWVSRLTQLPGVAGPELWAVGNFEFANGQVTDRLTRLSGGQWQPQLLGLGTTTPVDVQGFVDENGPRIYLVGRPANNPANDVVLVLEGGALQVSTPLSFASHLEVHDDGTGPALYMTRAVTETYKMTANGGGWTQVPTATVYGTRTGLVSVTIGAASALLSLGRPQFNGMLQGAHPVASGGGPRLDLRQAAPGAPVTGTNANLIQGSEYYNLVSLEPCPVQGAGPYGGLCATNQLWFLQQQLALPVGTRPFHFLADRNVELFAPVSLPTGVVLEAVCVRLSPTGPSISSVSRLTVQ